VPGRRVGDLVFGTDDGDVGVERLCQCAGRYLGADAARVSESNC
jgi:hypothetical protein